MTQSLAPSCRLSATRWIDARTSPQTALLLMSLVVGGMLCVVGCQTSSDLPEASETSATETDEAVASADSTDRVNVQEDDAVGTDPTELDGADGRELLLRNFRPEPQLKVDHTLLQQARFPVIDVHTHFRYKTRNSSEFVDDFINVMDQNKIAVCVSLDGRLGDELEAHKQFLWTKYPDRFAIFINIDWIGDGQQEDPATWACQRDDFVRNTVESMKQAKEQGACGLKLFKQFGLGYRDATGELLKIDDPRWDPIWQTCGELGFAVLIHTADPMAFFDPIDKTNERWEELSRHPDWSFYGDEFPSRESLIEARNRIIERHPETTFIAAHVANNSEDLATVAEWLDRYPNMVVEFASRIGELGRQPYTARRFLIDYQDRVLFGTDGPWPEARLHLYWRFLETYDEYIPYSEKEFPPQGFWRIYGVGLPDEVLKKIYFKNALRILPGVREKYERVIAREAFQATEQ